jgi:hypothetical protein
MNDRSEHTLGTTVFNGTAVLTCNECREPWLVARVDARDSYTCKHCREENDASLATSASEPSGRRQIKRLILGIVREGEVEEVPIDFATVRIGRSPNT